MRKGRRTPLAVQLRRQPKPHEVAKALRDLERMAVKAKVPVEQRELGREELDWDGRENVKGCK